MYRFFRKRLLQKRLVALAAAYAIALSGLIANFTGAQMAIAAAAQPGSIICHTDFSGETAPFPGGQTDSNKPCIDGCCTGCLTFTAALPPAPANAGTIPPTASARIVPLAVAVFASGPRTKSHRSRAPPLTA